MFVFSILFFSTVYSQSEVTTIDWRNENLADTTRIQVLDSLIRKEYWIGDPDKSLLFIRQQDSLAKVLELTSWELRALENKAELFYYGNRYVEAIPVLKILLPRLESIADFKRLAEGYRQIGYCLRKTGQVMPALENYDLSLKYARMLGDKGRQYQAATLNSLGSLYLNRKEYDQAKNYYLQSLDLHTTIDKKRGISSNLNNLGLIFYNLEDYNQALEYIGQSLEIKKEMGDKRGIANVYAIYGDIYKNIEKLEEAEEMAIKSLHIRKELKLMDDVANSYLLLGNIAFQGGDLPSALGFCQQASEIADDAMVWEMKAACHDCLYKIYKSQGNSIAALREYESFITVQDSIFNENNTKELAVLEASHQYETELAVSRAKQKMLTDQASRERFLRWILLAMVGALILLSWLVFRISRSRMHKNTQLEEKNKKIKSDHELIQKQAADLAELAVIKNRFFTDVSHELRTPLTLVVTPLEKILRQNISRFSSSTRESLKIVYRNAQKLLLLVEELLELARLESNTAQVQKHKIGLKPFFEQIFENFTGMAMDRNIDYRFLYDSDPRLAVICDSDRLGKIVNNLLSNALKFTQKGGRIVLVIKTSFDGSKDGMLFLQVIDNGIGIPEEDLLRIFDRYFQVSPKAKIGHKGNGIGLALAMESTRLLEGQLVAHNNPEGGSTFKLSIPITKSSILPQLVPKKKHSLKESLYSLGTTARQRILIVEDNTELRVFLNDILLDFDCTTAENGREALELIEKAEKQSKSFDLLITDLMMPEMDGFQLVEEIKSREDFRKMRLIVLTARHELDSRLKMLRIGVDDYLTKPFSIEELTARVVNLLRFSLEKNDLNDQVLTPFSASQLWLKELEGAIFNLLEDQKELSVNTVANAMSTSNRQLLRKIKSITGLSTQKYLLESKLNIARKFLEQQQFYNVAEVAHACGFNTPGYFSTLYLERFGRRPGSYFS